MVELMASRLTTFWRWWSGELRAVFPEGLFVGAAREAMAVVRTGSNGRYSLVPDGPAAPAVEGDAGRVAAALKSRPGFGGEAVVTLPADALLVLDHELPERALGRVREILALELESATPFAADEASFDYVAGAEDAKGLCRVRQYIVKNSLVSRIVDDFRRNGVAIRRVNAENASTINLLPETLRERRAPRFRPEYAALAGAALFLIAGVHAWQARTLAALEATRADLAAQTASVRAAAAEVNAAASNIDALRKRLEASPPALQSLAALTQALDDSAWLSELTIVGRSVSMTGVAASAARVVNDLEASPAFSGASFSATVFTDPATNTERFSARAQIDAGQSPAAEGAPE